MEYGKTQDGTGLYVRNTKRILMCEKTSNINQLGKIGNIRNKGKLLGKSYTRKLGTTKSNFL